LDRCRARWEGDKVTTIVAAATIFISLGGLLDFLLGEPGNRKVRDCLIGFYVGIEEGDWSLLYRVPADSLLRFTEKLLSDCVFSIKFAIRTVLLSVSVTALMLISYLIVVYSHAVWNQTPECQAPPLALALEVPIYLRNVLYQAFLVNAAFDVITWSATIYALRIMNATQNRYIAFGIVFVIAVFSLFTLHILHSIYLPISLAIEVHDFGLAFGLHEY
jgi:hypothetical protein